MPECSGPKDQSAERAGRRVEDFHYDLPEDLIAQEPPAERGSSRMLVRRPATVTLRLIKVDAERETSTSGAWIDEV